MGPSTTSVDSPRIVVALGAALALKRAFDHRGAAGLRHLLDERIDERDKVVRQAYSDLLAHDRTAPIWDAAP